MSTESELIPVLGLAPERVAARLGALSALEALEPQPVPVVPTSKLLGALMGLDEPVMKSEAGKPLASLLGWHVVGPAHE